MSAPTLYDRRVLLVAEHAQMTWKSGLQERSDGITDLLVEFDLKFPEAKR